MSIMALKFLHVAAISVWAFGLLALPVLFRQRNAVAEGPALHALHRAARFSYIGAISPAAILAIASGLALIPLRSTFDLWFLAKLLAVAGLVMLHLIAGSTMVTLFADKRRYPGWRFGGGILIIGAVISAILFLVLEKPAFAPDFPAALTEPGGLRMMIPDRLLRLLPVP